VLDDEDQVMDLGTERTVSAEVLLGALSPDDVAVHLVHGSVGPNDELSVIGVVDMHRVDGDQARHCYVGSFTGERAGRYGFTARVVPSHPDLASPADLGRVTWA
jgi:starch phosphorylase